MTFSVTVQPSGHQFLIENHETVLAAALRAGIALPYGCKNGACGSCKGKLLEGTVTHDHHSTQALSREEQTRGLALFCSAHAQSDLVIESREVRGTQDIPIKKIPARIAHINKLTHDVITLRLQLPANQRLQYLAGQYVELILKDGRRRSYSMAGAPHAAEQLELHIRHFPGGVFTDNLFGVGATPVKERDILRLEGPFGSFFLREENTQPMILIASGTGFAPIKAMIEHALMKKIITPMRLYWGGRRPQDLYMAQLAQSWADQFENFTFIPVISDALAEDQWTGRSGFVHRAVMEDFSDLADHVVYACGAPVMVEAARRDLIEQRGLSPEGFFADAFVTEADQTC